MRTRTTTRTTCTSILATLAVAGTALGQGGYPDEPVDAAFLRGVYGFGVFTTHPGARLGRSIAPAGDFNGDGVDDLAVGSLQSGIGFGTVIFGRADGAFADSIRTDPFDGTAGLVIVSRPTAIIARSITGVGDMDGDGGDDLYISSSPGDLDSDVVGYVLFGRPPGGPGGPMPAQIELGAAVPDQGVALTLGEPYRFLNPYGVGAAAGDINADGLPDLIVSVAEVVLDDQLTSRVFVVYGQPDGLPERIALDELDGTDGFVIVPEADGDYLGADLAGAGDVNGDGVDDIIMGAPGGSGSSRLLIIAPGAGYVVFGKQGGVGAEVRLADLDGANGFAFKPDAPTLANAMGKGVAGVGDLNGDGIDDVAFGEPGAMIDDLRGGMVHVVYGRTGGFPALLTPGDLTEGTGLTIHQEPSQGALGWSVGAAGDINGDGAPDMAIGAPGSFGLSPRVRSGAILVFGSTDGTPLGEGGVLDVSQVGGDRAVRLFQYDTTSQFGNYVHGVGDLNADGVDDLGVGAWQDSGDQGRAFVHLGGGLCRPDLTADGVLDVFDFLEFFNLYEAGGDFRTDWNGDYQRNIFDFLAYQSDFDAGCP
ncbi:MAG: GC-type dockerin domain-anchored protein [Phycisphaerales bacterium JB060]